MIGDNPFSCDMDDEAAVSIRQMEAQKNPPIAFPASDGLYLHVFPPFEEGDFLLFDMHLNPIPHPAI